MIKVLIFIIFFFFHIGCKVEINDLRPALNLSWEEEHPERQLWSYALMGQIGTYWDRLQFAKDIHYLCHNYATLSEEEQKEVWAELFVAIAFYESSWNPNARSFETTMGYYSEGLFQMSYVDESWAKCGFDESKGNALDPVTNINCAVKVLSSQVKRTGKILLKRNERPYWAVIITDGRYSKIPQIKNRIEKSILNCN